MLVFIPTFLCHGFVDRETCVLYKRHITILMYGHKIYFCDGVRLNSSEPLDFTTVDDPPKVGDNKYTDTNAFG